MRTGMEARRTRAVYRARALLERAHHHRTAPRAACAADARADPPIRGSKLSAASFEGDLQALQHSIQALDRQSSAQTFFGVSGRRRERLPPLSLGRKLRLAASKWEGERGRKRTNVLAPQKYTSSHCIRQAVTLTTLVVHVLRHQPSTAENNRMYWLAKNTLPRYAPHPATIRRTSTVHPFHGSAWGAADEVSHHVNPTTPPWAVHGVSPRCPAAPVNPGRCYPWAPALAIRPLSWPAVAAVAVRPSRDPLSEKRGAARCQGPGPSDAEERMQEIRAEAPRRQSRKGGHQERSGKGTKLARQRRPGSEGARPLPLLGKTRIPLPPKSPSHSAAVSGDSQALEALLQHGANVQAATKDGTTALHIAAAKGAAHVIPDLVTAGADKDARTCKGWSPLHAAAQTGSAATIRELLSFGADTEARTSGHRATALHVAALRGNLEAVEVLAGEGKADVHSRQSDALTPLLLAAFCGHGKVVRALVAAGAVMDARDAQNKAALHMAALAGHVRVAEELLQLGADVDVQADNGSTPLLLAAQEGHHKMVECLADADANVDHCNIAGLTPLHAAVTRARRKAVDALIDKGADVNAHTCASPSMPLLHVAARLGHVGMVDSLLRRGAVLESLSEERGQTALHAAASEGHLEVARLLVAQGLDVDVRSGIGETPLLVAVKKQHIQVAAFLLEAGADVNAERHTQISSIHMAAGRKHMPMLELLLSNGANIEASNSDVGTPLLMASGFGHEEVVQCLLAKGAAVNAAHATNGFTPLFAASLAGHSTIVDILLASGADPELRDVNGRKAVEVIGMSTSQRLPQEEVEQIEEIFRRHAAEREASQELLEPQDPCIASPEVELDSSSCASSCDEDEENDTSLYKAACAGEYESVLALLAAGARVGNPGDDGWTALFAAVNYGHLDIAMELVKAGANVNTIVPDRGTALHAAAGSGYVAMVSQLIAAGAMVDAATSVGETPLHVAARHGHRAVVTSLIQKGADVNRRRQDSARPIHLAAERGHKGVVEELMTWGADTAASRKDGATALDLGKLHGHHSLVDLLLGGKVDVDSANTEAWAGVAQIVAPRCGLDVLDELSNCI
eukprot:evm.model.scf_1535.3 EVM.evm.TU.scf_1535.3   scf_1535:22230-35004(+)